MSIVFIGEVFGTTCMKLADRFKNKLPTAGLVPGYIVAFVALGFVIMDLPLGIATEYGLELARRFLRSCFGRKLIGEDEGAMRTEIVTDTIISELVLLSLLFIGLR